MAAAYRVIDRTHAPLTSPLEDLNPSTAHLKVHWPSSFQRLQETLVQSDFGSGVDYSSAKPQGVQLEIDNLIIFNVYKTADRSVSWGLGPSPLSPLYLSYSALHPADPALSKPAKPGLLANASGVFSPNRSRQLAARSLSGRPHLIQFFLDRKDFATHVSTTVACVRFQEEFIEWRLIPKPDTPAGTRVIMEDSIVRGSRSRPYRDTTTAAAAQKNTPTSSSRRGFSHSLTMALTTTPQKEHVRQPSIASTQRVIKQPFDVPAACIFLMPTIQSVDNRRTKPLLNMLTSFASELGSGALPMYTTTAEVDRTLGIELFFSLGAAKKTYWWICESTSWRAEFDPTEITEVRGNTKTYRTLRTKENENIQEVSPSGRSLQNRSASSSASSSPTSPSFGPRSRMRRSSPDSKKKKVPVITCGTVKLYAASQLKPVACVELGTGQMWIIRSMMIETMDIAVAVMFAIMNVERAFIEEHSYT